MTVNKLSEDHARLALACALLEQVKAVNLSAEADRLIKTHLVKHLLDEAHKFLRATDVHRHFQKWVE